MLLDRDFGVPGSLYTNSAELAGRARFCSVASLRFGSRTGSQGARFCSITRFRSLVSTNEAELARCPRLSMFLSAGAPWTVLQLDHQLLGVATLVTMTVHLYALLSWY